MRTFGLALLLVTLAAGAFAQQAGVWSYPRTYGSPTGFGNILFPGMGTAPPAPPVGSITDPSHARRLGSIVSGYPPYTGAPTGRPGHGRSLIVPFGIPVFVGGGYGYGGYGVAPPQQQTTTVVQQSPPVVINQYYSPEVVRPVMREYTDLPEAVEQRQPGERENVRIYPAPKREPAPEPAPRREAPAEDKATVTLIAFQDSSIVAVLGYWIEGDTLQYVTTQFAKRSAPLNQVDRPLSEQLNRERSVEFKLR